MDYGYFHYEEKYTRPRGRRVNYFGWTVAILLLTGAAMAAWLLSFYIFGQPERPDSYRVLQKLGKVDPTKRFELTAAPAGEFLTAKQIFERYSQMGNAELAKTNAELARNFIRNYQGVRGLVPYVIGRFMILEPRELGNRDIFTTGMVALTNAIDDGEVLMEHVYPADAQALPLMKQTLTPGLELKLERTHDLSAIIHVERLNDGRMMITAVPLLYGTYTVTRGTGTFTLEPPLALNLDAGWPLFKELGRQRAELHYADFKRGLSGSSQSEPLPMSGLSAGGTPPPAQNALVHVESAKAVAPVATPSSKLAAAKATPAPKHGKLAKNQKASPSPAASASPAQVAQATPIPVVVPPVPPQNAAVPQATAPAPSPVAVAANSPAAATPVPGQIPNPSGALASTAGGGSWKTFAPGKMPLGRLIGTTDLKDLADRGGLVGERVYLKGQFVVNFVDANKAVLRPRTKLASAMLHLGGSGSTRIIVEFPAGYVPPAQGTVVNRDDARPLEITEVRKEGDGELNVFAREIMQ